MERPKISVFKKPKHINEYPLGTCFTGGHLVTENASWRTEKPVIDTKLCGGCLICYMCCPEGVIYKTEQKVAIDYRFCKGCGICARECKKQAIQMVREE